MDPPGYKAPQKWRVRGVILDQHQARSKPHRITSSTIEVRILTLHTTLQHFLFQASLQHPGWRIASGFWFEYGSKACTPNFIGWFPEESIAPSLARLWIGVPRQFQHQSLRQGYLQWSGWRSSSPKTDLRRRKTTAVDLFMLVLVSKSRSLLHHILQNQNIDDMATVDQYSHLVSLVYVCSQIFRTFQRMQAPLSMTSCFIEENLLTFIHQSSSLESSSNKTDAWICQSQSSAGHWFDTLAYSGASGANLRSNLLEGQPTIHANTPC